MYQWVNPSTGNTQLSGSPPAWYRTRAGGPRVLVFEDGKLIDDSAVAVAPDEGDELRRQAFERRRELEEKLLLAPGLRGGAGAEEVGPAQEGVPEGGAAGPATDAVDADMVARLKEIISAWDRAQLEEAKRLLQGDGEAGPSLSSEEQQEQEK
jgi:hypothetical protein